MKKLIKNTTRGTYYMRHCCQDTPKRAVHAEGGAVSINTEVKSEDTEITDTRNHRHVRPDEPVLIGGEKVPAYYTSCNGTRQ